MVRAQGGFAISKPLTSQQAPLFRHRAAGDPPVDPDLRNDILLITILLAFLEGAAQKLSPQTPRVVMGFAGIVAMHQQTDDHL